MGSRHLGVGGAKQQEYNGVVTYDGFKRLLGLKFSFSAGVKRRRVGNSLNRQLMPPHRPLCSAH